MEPLAPFGPPPFQFTPQPQPCTCRAFSLPFRLLALVIVLGCAYGLLGAWSSGQLTYGAGTAASSGLLWALAAMALLLYTLWCIWTSHTTLSAQGLHQNFVWDKKMELRELAYVKLIRVPGLDWLIAPRLYCRTLLGKFAVFYAADAHMISEWERMRDALRAFRQNQM
jgi:hypothetical protein